MRSTSLSILATLLAVLLGLTPAVLSGAEIAASDAGFCGQPKFMTSETISMNGETEEVAGRFVDLERNEPRYLELRLAARAQLTFSTRGANVDTILLLLDSSGNLVTSDDDGGDVLDSRLVTVLQPGNYCLQVSKFGDYEEMLVNVPVTITAGPGPEPCVRTASNRYDLAADSEAIITSDVLQDRATFALELRAGTGVRIEAKSPVFDTLLSLEDDKGEVVAQNDDSGEGTDSAIELAPVTQDAEYCAVLDSYDPDGGIYALSFIPLSE